MQLLHPKNSTYWGDETTKHAGADTVKSTPRVLGLFGDGLVQRAQIC